VFLVSASNELLYAVRRSTKTTAPLLPLLRTSFTSNPSIRLRRWINAVQEPLGGYVLVKSVRPKKERLGNETEALKLNIIMAT
jgi:hypothetical protein